MSAFVPFSPDSMMWRINRERVVLLGGASAALLQVAHPQVAMGVAAHSRFHSDSIGRLRRTLDAVYTVAFGNAGEVGRVRAAVARAHGPVQGENPLWGQSAHHDNLALPAFFASAPNPV